jgi:hypothetical protein
VQILEDEDHRVHGALGGEQILEGAPHLVAHQDLVLARGAELDAIGVGEPNAHELTEELGHARERVAVEDAAEAADELVARGFARLTRREADHVTERRRDRPERGACAHRVGSSLPDVDGGGARR